MRRNVVGIVVLALLAVQAYAKVVPIIHCWEEIPTGTVMYIGANNDQAELQEIPTGNHNHLSDSLVPPMMFWSGFNGFMHGYTQQPDWALDWFLNDGSNTYEVQMSTQATQKRCDPNGVLLLTFHFDAVPAAFEAMDKIRTATNIEFVLLNNFAFPYAAMGTWTWTATANGFTGSVEIHRGPGGESPYYMASRVAAKTGDRSMGETTRELDNAIYAPTVPSCCSLSHVAANGTATDVQGTVVNVPAPGGITPHPPVSIPPGQLPALPVIPTADCYERNGTNMWFYFGVNNTNPGEVQIPIGGSNLIQTLPDQRSLSTPDSFPPGFSAFTAAVSVPTPPNAAASSQWVLLNHYVTLIGSGNNQECKTAQDQKVWVYFNGAMPTTIANIIQQLETATAEQIPGLPYAPGSRTNTLSIITSQDSDNSWHMEITLIRGPVSQFRAAAYLYNAFYNANAYTTKLAEVARSAPTRLTALPTSVEKYGIHRPAPMAPSPISNPTPGNLPPHKKLSGGAIFGIIVGVFAGIAVIGAVVWYLRKHSPVASNNDGYDKLIQ